MPVQIVNHTKSMITVLCHNDRERTTVLRREYDRSTGQAFQRPTMLDTPRPRRLLVGSNKGLPDAIASEREVLVHEKAGRLTVTRYLAPKRADHAAATTAQTTQQKPAPARKRRGTF